MGRPITTTKGGICFAFPNVCQTQVGPATVPIPYPSIGQLGDAAGQAGVTSGTVGGKVEFVSYSATVKAGGSEVVRMFDQTRQNDGNAVGVVLGGLATVLVGG